MDVDEALQALRFWLDGCERAVVAFSGGIDSALVAVVARQTLGFAAVEAAIAVSPSLKHRDLEAARRFAHDHDLRLTELVTGELARPAYAENPPDRCYHCKQTLYETIQAQWPEPTIWILSGANHDDRGDYRPGLRAAAEAQVRHPLLACGIGKDLVRALARALGLSCHDKPASPCLSSRIPYGQPVTAAKLARIEATEGWLEARGFPICRVRHDERMARIEVPVSDLPRLETVFADCTRYCRSLGFAGAVIDREGFVSGKLNRALGEVV